MAPTTIKGAIKDVLENLTQENLEKFRSALLDRRGERRVKTSAVEGKNYLVIADVLVSTFTESGAVEVTLELLKQIACNEEAEELASDIKRLTSTSCSGPSGGASGPSGGPSGGASGPSGGASGGSAMAGGVHFVDKHRAALIQRVTLVEPILDELLDRKVIKQEAYNLITSQTTSQAKMRELYKGPLCSCGIPGKNIFYEILRNNESLLVEDLNQQ